MNNNNNYFRSQWRSEIDYLLVTTGAVVGLGNFFLFPFLVAKFGGVFVLFYLLCEIAISIPLFFSELLIGRRGKQNPVGSIGILSIEADANYHWRLLGWLTFIVVFLSLAYYICAAAFPVGFFYSTLTTLLTSQPQGSLISIHSSLMTNFWGLEACFLFFMIATMLVIIRGINRGLEMISRIVVPTYFLILVVLTIYSFINNDFNQTFTALFDFSNKQEVTAALYAALSFAFFKLGVGMGTMIVYGSYLPYSVSFGRSTLLIVCFDAIISLLAFFCIYPLILKSNIDVLGGELISHNVLSLFTSTPGGLYIAVFFFLASIIAAWTPTIAMAETAVITIIERFNLSRFIATIYLSLAILLMGTLVVLTHTQWQHVVLFNTIPLLGITFSFTSKVLTLFAAFFITIFAGWVLPQRITNNELGFKPLIYKIWLFLVRFVAPISIILIVLLTL